jgi:hypothetical protein
MMLLSGFPLSLLLGLLFLQLSELHLNFLDLDRGLQFHVLGI